MHRKALYNEAISNKTEMESRKANLFHLQQIIVRVGLRIIPKFMTIIVLRMLMVLRRVRVSIRLFRF